MILGMSIHSYTVFHVAISLIGIVSGLVFMFGLVARRPSAAWTTLFLVTTVLTSVTGFGFPSEHLDPAQIVGIISLGVLAAAITARYVFHMSGIWRSIFVISSAIALYLNVFVLVVQLFEKVPALHALAPEGKEPPFVISQLLVMALFIVLTVFATIKSRPEPARVPLARAA